MSGIILKASSIVSRGARLILDHPKRFNSRSHVIKTEDLLSRYGGKTNITVLPGVGIGPEIMEKTLTLLQAAKAPLTYEILPISSTLDDEFEDTDVEFMNILTSIRRNKVALKGNIEVKSKSPLVKSRNILLRKNLNLFVYVLHCKTMKNLPNKFGEFDIIVIRQNTEGEYLMLEHEPMPGTVENLRVITRDSSERTAKYAFDYAVRNNRKHITVVYSAETQTRSEGVFLGAALDVSKDYPNITVDVSDAAVMANNIVLNPRRVDVILATNLNGSMLSNIMIGMVGGPGLTAGTNFGENQTAVFEPGARNKGSSIVGKGIASPIAMISAAINLLEHLQYNSTAEVLQESLYNTLVKDKIRTKDLGGKATTQEVTDRMIDHVKRLLKPRGRPPTSFLPLC